VSEAGESAVRAAQPEALAAFLAQLVLQIREAKLTGSERATVWQHLLDGLASAFVGCHTKTFKDLLEISRGGQREDIDGGLSLQERSMLWAFAINSSVFEDGSREGACHPAGAVASVVLALGEDRSWDVIDKAVIAGYEVMIRLAKCGNPHFARKGFHPTAIVAPFGAAATLAQLMGYDGTTTQHALCLAAMAGAGLMASFKEGSTQPLQVAWAVRSGIAAALLAGKGNAGYPRILEEGFLPAYLGSDGSASVRAPLEFEYAIQGAYLKPFPGCRHMHSSLDALDILVRKHRPAAEQIENIRVGTYKIAMETEIESLDSRGDAYFNLPYALAARLVLGKNDYESFDERHFGNPAIRRLMGKISVSIDEEIEKRYPKLRGSKVEVQLVSGQVLSCSVDYALGEPENPLPISVTQQKLRDNTKGILSAPEIEEIEKLGEVREGSAPLAAISRLLASKLFA